ncbi:TBC1 domain family member 22A-like isoform X1 [Durio zibethinus]|uniref:TBC1 domain family member 22A-like isoform X1 n=1 Tax=Durio zibethinus TaxID=66656 RepID=A0A6P6A9P3_DURZI|nr:TBC1 domain family member 22A-like isoform X1 [Durio zibethinus]
MNNNSHGEEHQREKESLDSRFNQTLRNVQGLLKGRSIPGKVLLTRRPDPLDNSGLEERSPSYQRSFSQNDAGTIYDMDKSMERLRELAWSGVPPYMHPNIWRLLLGYAPPNSDRKEGVLRRKRLEYLNCVAQFYDIPDTQQSDDEINMLLQIAVDCPRTVPDVAFFQQAPVQKSLERILYTWAIRHPASGYVQGLNDLVTPFLVVFLSEYLEGSIDSWSISDISSENISNIEADCYWCLSKLLDGMQDRYTFAQQGIQRLVFKLKELVRRIDEPVSRHMEEQGLEFVQFAFRWFSCLLIREVRFNPTITCICLNILPFKFCLIDKLVLPSIFLVALLDLFICSFFCLIDPFHLVTHLWDTYLAEGDALPDFLVYMFASFLLTRSDKLQKLDFQELVMFLQHLPTHNRTYQELEMVLSRAYLWHSLFNSSPNHLAS